ncbi:MAG: MBOAT family protein [Firmicutes bacterium]|nr:MBOAT family protein [Bacillota bacterium]
MVFSSISFLVYFLPVVLALYYLIPVRFRPARNTVLLVASLVFYACGGVRYLALMAAIIATDYICGLQCQEQYSAERRRGGVIASVVISLALLGWFKYAGFFTANLAALGIPVRVLSIALPVGLSFYTFQGLSYVIDAYRGKVPVQKNPASLALYISLFPQLVAGPIVRYSDIVNEIDHRKETVEDWSAGFTRFCFGLGKKMLLANTMGNIADAAFAVPAESLPASMAWVGILAYIMQIYLDFSAYSDMAIGLGRMFGFHFLENFNYPYISRSVTEFWRRWHISLSSWFRDYVYFPLGGSYCSRLKIIRNLTVVWLLTGFWHGANWTFIFWGVWYLAFLLGEKYLWGRRLEVLPGALQWLYTILIVIGGWVFFRSPDLHYACRYLLSMIGMGGGLQPAHSAVYYLLEYWPELICSLFACLPLKNRIQEHLEKKDTAFSRAVLAWGPKILALLLLVLSYCKLVTGSFNPFIYYQF